MFRIVIQRQVKGEWLNTDRDFSDPVDEVLLDQEIQKIEEQIAPLRAKLNILMQVKAKGVSHGSSVETSLYAAGERPNS